MKRLLRLLRAFKRDESGAAAIMVALMMPVLAGMAALSVDVLFVFNQQEQLRTAAEAAATAGVTVLPNRADARRTALAYANMNAHGGISENLVSADEIEIGYWDTLAKKFVPTEDGQRTNAIRVTASRSVEKGNPQPTFFGQVLGVTAFDAVEVSAIAALSDSYPCINVLAPTTTSLPLSSNARIDLKNCGIHVHSADGAAMAVESNAEVKVVNSEICIRGGYRVRSNSDVDPTPETNCSPMSDQFAGVAAPSIGGCERWLGPVNSNQTVNLQPCTYRGGFTLNSNSRANLAPGLYVIKDGPLIINSNATLSGTGVVFYFTGNNAQVIFNSNADIQLSAPTSGPLAGFVLFQDRNYGGDHIFNSNASTLLDGAIYLPKGTIKMNSNTQIGSTSRCMMIVAYRIEINSNSGLDIRPNYSDCPSPSSTRKSRVVG